MKPNIICFTVEYPSTVRTHTNSSSGMGFARNPGWAMYITYPVQYLGRDKCNHLNVLRAVQGFIGDFQVRFGYLVGEERQFTALQRLTDTLDSDLHSSRATQNVLGSQAHGKHPKINTPSC
jgi:hypothetical protein